MTCMLKKRFFSFSLLELLTAMAIIGVTVIGALSVFSLATRSTSDDEGLVTIRETASLYLGGLYLAKDVRSLLFSPGEIGELETSGFSRLKMTDLVTNFDNNRRVRITRRVHRWKPLLVSVGIDFIGVKDGRENIVHFETEYSDLYMDKIRED